MTVPDKYSRKTKFSRKNPIQRITKTLQDAGLRVMVSFDSRQTQLDQQYFSCPHHGTADCDCHIVVLLVYGTEAYPASLIAYGQDDEIRVSLIYPPGLRPSHILQSQIISALKPSLIQT